MTSSNRATDNISLTAFRVIAILEMLKEAPHSEAEINEKLKGDPLLARSLSKDSIWIYINTLKALGCNISRPAKTNNYKYVLKDHPFKIYLSDSEIKALQEAKKYAANLGNWQICCNYDKFLSTISCYLEEDAKSNFLSIAKSSQRDIDYLLKVELICELEIYCNRKTLLSIDYISSSNNKSDKRLLVDYIKYENGALYLWGYNIDTEETQYLRIDRIDSISELDDSAVPSFKPPLKAVYKLFDDLAVCYQPDDNEQIIDRSNKCITIEARVENKFKLIQQLLSFGRNCLLIEPQELKQDLVKKLNQMLQVYNK